MLLNVMRQQSDTSSEVFCYTAAAMNVMLKSTKTRSSQNL